MIVAALLILIGIVLLLPLPLVGAPLLLADCGLKDSRCPFEPELVLFGLGCLGLAIFGLAMIRAGWRRRNGRARVR